MRPTSPPPNRPRFANLTVLVALLASVTACRAHADEVPNPEYTKWAALEEGSWVRVRITGDLRHADWKYTLEKVTPEVVVLRVTETRYGKPADKPREERVKATLTAELAAPDDAGEEELKVGEQAHKCRRETRRRAPDPAANNAGENEVTTWVSDDVPGFVKRVTRFAADAKAGLPEGETIETVVGYELRLRAPDGNAPAAPAGAGKPAAAVRRAGELGPTRFQWTYTFNPPGWRKWERVSETEWVERWETGEEQRFEIVRRIDDGERVGTVVTGMPDREIETVIPDAGKGATLWFRHLPDGDWSSLGQVEESE